MTICCRRGCRESAGRCWRLRDEMQLDASHGNEGGGGGGEMGDEVGRDVVADAVGVNADSEGKEEVRGCWRIDTSSSI